MKRQPVSSLSLITLVFRNWERRAWRNGVFFLSCGLIAFRLAQTSIWTPRDLLDRSQTFAVVASYLPGSAGTAACVADTQFWWITEYSGLIVRPSHLDGRPDEGHVVSGLPPCSSKAAGMAAVRGMIALQRGGTNDQDSNLVTYDIGSFHPSPRGNWALFAGVDLGLTSTTDVIRVSAFETSHPDRIISTTGRMDETYQWLSSGRSWVGMYTEPGQDTHLQLFTMRNDKVLVRDSILPHVADPSYNPSLAGISGGSLVALGQNPNSSRFELRVFKIGGISSCADLSVEYTDIRAPAEVEGQQVLEYQLSPDCKDFAWLIQKTQYPFGVSSLTPTLNRLGLVPYYIQSVWVSNAAGLNARCIGELRIQPGHIIHSLAWVPGGKSISFIFDHAVYTTQLDASN